MLDALERLDVLLGLLAGECHHQAGLGRGGRGLGETHEGNGAGERRGGKGGRGDDGVDGNVLHPLDGLASDGGGLGGYL
jgi:hypothetical protein